MSNKYDLEFMRTAYVWAAKSYCKRRRVGAALVNSSRPLSSGYNGTVSGADNCCEEDFGDPSDIESRVLSLEGSDEKNYIETAKEFCNEFGLIFERAFIEDNHIQLRYRRPQVRTKLSVMHAEANAIAFAAKKGLSTEGSTMYVTLSPCLNCANLIIQAGIKEVVYSEGYRDTSGIDHLEKNGVHVRQFKLDKESFLKGLFPGN